MVPPSFSRPSRSAASIIARAGRSLIEPDGFALSSFRKSSHGPVSRRFTATSGVPPMRSSIVVIELLHPLYERLGYSVRTLDGREMAAIRDCHKLARGDQPCDLLGNFGRRERIGI